MMSDNKITLNYHTTVLVAIWVGILGVDRFMMRHNGFAIFKLLTAGGFGIFWILDMIRIARKSDFKGTVE